MNSRLDNPETVQSSVLEDKNMRARWQKGSVRLEGKHVRVWVGRFLEDVIGSNGQTDRVQRSVRLGTLQQFPTKRAAQRELDKYTIPINAVSYRPKHKITFKEFSDKWIRDVLPQFKPAGRASTNSNIKILNSSFGSLELSAITVEMLQRWITSRTDWSAKTVSNYVTTLQRLWKSAKAWGYVTGDPFEGLVLPKPELNEKASFLPETIKQIIGQADEPYKTMFWIVAETGIRGGELCGLFTSDVDIEARMIFVRRSAFQGKLQTPKTGNAVRAFPISEALAEHIKQYTESVQEGYETDCEKVGGDRTRKLQRQSLSGEDAKVARPEHGGRGSAIHRQSGSPQEGTGGGALRGSLLFVTPRGCPYDNGNIVKRALKPILRSLGIDGPRVGLHSFRHSNISAMGSLGIPDSVQLDRAGHGSIRMKRHYAHSFSEDHLRAADKLGKLFAPDSPKPETDSSETVQTLAMGAD